MVALASLATLAAASCDDGDGDEDTAESAPTTAATTEAPTTITDTTQAPATTEAVTTSESPPTTAAAPTTEAPPATDPPATTIDVEALKAQIAADYERAFLRGYDLLADPTLEDLESTAAEVAVPGSPAYEFFVKRVGDLVQLGDRVVPNEPDIVQATVESVELVGSAPYSQAVIVVCEVENRRQITPAENTPDGVEVEVLGSGDLIPVRIDAMPVQLTDRGWLRTESQYEAEAFPGQQTCGAPS